MSGRGAGLLSDDELERSAVVANCAMNRERQLSGVNSYARELGFDPLAFLASRLTADAAPSTASWLDLCCGAGLALIQAAGKLAGTSLAGRVSLTGVDLAGMFIPRPSPAPALRLVAASVTAWEPDRAFDLITCVHGLHYVGDKLATLIRAASWLTPGGLFIADLDLTSIRVPGGQTADRRLAARLRAAGFAYSIRRHQITRTGPASLRLPYTYLGADDRAGPGYTGQPAVHSYYEEEAPDSQPAEPH
ncbi:MAG TPA: class I SAM-dependent methyltransferase [Streptosporangiaceae bacterium]|nr:class I SAM-dependent methyltransferase [Streptosporangiaceae bacterium]